MHTLTHAAPDLLLVVTWLMEIVGVTCCAIGLYVFVRRGWDTGRLLTWLTPSIIAQAMERFGWAPLVLSLAVLAGCWLWVRRENRMLEGEPA